MNYTNKGQCIFCLRGKFETEFTEKPHTMPKSLGGVSIGVDICNECNHYFGEPDLLSNPQLNIEVCVKEIFGIIKVLLNCLRDNNQKQVRKNLKSIYFEYWKSKNKIVIKKAFRLNYSFINTFTNQFKRGLYEMFIQEYHKETGNGLNSKFNEIREYARYNRGDVPLYYAVWNILPVGEDINTPKFNFSKHQFETIDTYGFYTLILWGQWFFMEVTPRAKLCREIYLKNEERTIVGTGTIFKGIIEVKKITDIDFTLSKLYD